MMRITGLDGARAMRLVVPLTLAGVLMFIGLLISDYNACWMHPEVPWRDVPLAFRGGAAVTLRDFASGFDPANGDGTSRARFVAYVLHILNEKMRVWLFHYMVPHPSLSHTWLFTLVISPLLLFRFLRDTVRTPSAGWIGVTLYLASVGTLSGITMLGHPAKPLANFLAILCLWIASGISRDVEGRGGSPRGVRLRFVALLLVLFTAFCTDESAWFLWFAIPLLFPQIFTRGGWRVQAAVLYGAVLAFFFFFVIVLVPRITSALGFARFDFVQWTFGERNPWHSFHAANVVRNASGIILCQLVFSQGLFLHEPLFFDGKTHLLANAGAYDPWTIAYGAALCACAVFLVFRMPASSRRLFTRYGVVLLLFVLFQTALLARTKQVIYSSYYYGALASVFLTIPLTILLSSASRGGAGALCRALLVLVVAASLYNFARINESWVATHSDPRFYDEFMGEQELAEWGPPNARVTRDMVRKAWSSRDDAKSFMAMRSKFPARAYWLDRECAHIR